MNTHNDHKHPPSPFDNPEKFIEKFDGVERDKWQKPDAVMQAFNLQDNAVVIEVGAGTGYFVMRLAEQLKNGKIIAFDQSANMTSHLQNRVRELGLSNVSAYTTETNGIIALEEKADLIFSVDVYHHMQNRIQYYTNLASQLKPEGRLVIIDRTEEKVEGQPLGHRVSAKRVKEEMRKAGFELVQELDFLLPIQYYLSFK